MTVPAAEVDLAFAAVLDPDHESRLVLRRSVLARTDEGREVSVRELWLSEPCPSLFDAAERVREAMRTCGRDLVRGTAVRALPGLARPTTAQLVELWQATEKQTVGTEYLAGYRGTVEGLWDGRPVVRGSDVVATDGFVAAQVRRLLGDVLRALAVPQCAAPAGVRAPAGRPPGPDAVRAALLRDLADARLRLDQEHGWARLATTALEFRLAVQPAPGWSEAVRRLPGGAPVEPTDEADRERDAVVVVFVSGRHGQVDLFRYRVDPHLDLPAVLGEPRVQEVFAACAAQPGDGLAQSRAVAALRGAERGPDAGRAPAPAAPGIAHLVATGEALDGVAVLHDCREIEVGNDDRRFNTFAYVFAPTATTGELLRSRPDVVAAIIDRSCQVDDSPGRRLRKALAAAVGADVPDGPRPPMLDARERCRYE